LPTELRERVDPSSDVIGAVACRCTGISPRRHRDQGVHFQIAASADRFSSRPDSHHSAGARASRKPRERRRFGPGGCSGTDACGRDTATEFAGWPRRSLPNSRQGEIAGFALAFSMPQRYPGRVG